MGTVTKRGTGYRAEVCVKGMRESRTFVNKAEARAWVSVREAYLTELKTEKTARIQFSELCRLWAERYPNRTQIDWEITRLKYLCDYGSGWLGALSLPSLDAKIVARWRDERVIVNGNGTVLRDWSLLSKVCTDAVTEMGLMELNPFKNAKRPTEPPARDRVATDEDIEALTIAASSVKQKEALRCFLFTCETGISAGEIAVFEYEQVVGSVAWMPPFKTRPKRGVPLSRVAQEILGTGEGKAFALTSALLDVHFRKLCIKAGVKGLTFHDGRATAATRLSKKLDAMALAKVLGHSDLKMLINVYYRGNPNDWVALLE